jgi:hypothetical protein
MSAILKGDSILLRALTKSGEAQGDRTKLQGEALRVSLQAQTSIERDGVAGDA